MRFVQLDTAITLSFELDERADATPTFVVKNSSGGETLASTNVTMDSVNTTLSGAASAGATTVSVASATGIAVGSKYLVGGKEATGGERVTVKSISGTTITLQRPLRLAKASGAAFASTKVSCALTAAAVPTIGRHYRVEITYAVSSVTQPKAVFPFDVVRYYPHTSLQLDDVADLDPIIAKRLPAGTWFPALRSSTWDMLLRRVAAKVEPGAIVGALDLTTPHAYLLRKVVLEGAGEEWKDTHDLMSARFVEEFDAAIATSPVDNDQDGAIEDHEGAQYRTIDLVRG